MEFLFRFILRRGLARSTPLPPQDSAMNFSRFQGLCATALALSLSQAALGIQLVAGPEPSGAPVDPRQDPIQPSAPLELLPEHLANQTQVVPLFDLVELDLPALPDASFQVNVPFEGEVMALDLYLHSVRDPEYQVYKRGPARSLIPLPLDHVRTFRGSVRGHPEAQVSGSILPSGTEMLIDLGTGRFVEVQPHFDSFLAGQRNRFIAFDTSTIIEPPSDCGTKDKAIEISPASSQAAAGSGCTGNYCGADLALELDFTHYTLYGSSDVASVAIAEQAVNVANLQYEQQLGIHHDLRFLVVNTTLADEPPSYAAAPTRLDLLGAFRAEWNANFTGVDRDTAHLMTARYTGGVAYVGVICSAFNAYGVDTTDSAFVQCRANVLAHELGHNWNAEHCACSNSGGISYTMHESYPPCALNFNPTLTVPDLAAYRDTRTCLDPHLEIDDVLNAQVIGPGSYFGSTDQATVDGTSSCDGSQAPGPDVWYRYTPSVNGNVTLQTCQSPTNFNTTLSLWRGCPRNAAATEIACNDNVCGLQSVLSSSVVAGTTYWIRLAGSNGARGVYNMILNGPAAAVPVNDDVEEAMIIGPGEYRGTLLSASSDGSAPCDGAGATRDVWYRYQPASSGVLRMDACVANFNVALSLHDATHPNPGSAAAVLECESVNCGLGASLITYVSAGNEYLIRVSGVGAQAGSFLLRVSGAESVASQSAMWIDLDESLVMDVDGAGTPNGSAVCGGTDANNLPAYKFRFIASANGSLRIRTCGTHDFGGIDFGVNTALSLHLLQGLVLATNTNQLACSTSNNGECFGDLGQNRDAFLDFGVQEGSSYLIRVGQVNRPPGASVVLLETEFTPSFDDCVGATPISPGTWQGSIGDNLTTDGSSNCVATSASPDVWYRFVAPDAGNLIVSTCGTRNLPGVGLGLNTLLSLHSGCPGDASNELTCGTNSSFGLCSSVDDAWVARGVTAGETVLIRLVSEDPNATGDFTLNVDFQPALGSSCNAPIVAGVGLYNVDLTPPSSTNGLQYQGSDDAWFRYMAPADGVLTVRTCGTHDMGGVDQGVRTFAAAYPSCSSVSPLAFHDQVTDSVCALADAGARHDERMPVTVQAGQVLFIRVGNEPGTMSGPVRVVLDFSEYPFTYCDGTGWRRDCPCGNQTGIRGEGCITSLGVGSLMSANGSGSLSADDLGLTVSNLRPNALMLFISGDASAFNPAYDGLICVGGDLIRAVPVQANASGSASLDGALLSGGLSRGASEIGRFRYLQGWFRDVGGPCSTGGNFSAGVQVRILP
jgi:hypothetical protein